MKKNSPFWFCFCTVGALLFILIINETHVYFKGNMLKVPNIRFPSRGQQPERHLWTQDQNTEKNLTIHILTWNRHLSLLRLLNSLLKTKFNGDFVNLVIHIDGGDDTNITYSEAVKFYWPFGGKTIIRNIMHKGLAMAWFNAWIPQSSTELGIIFEDDIIVSPWWYEWLKNAWQKYLFRNDVGGIALQRQSLIPQIPHKKKEIINNNEPFLFALVGSIGFSPHPRQWRKFIDWINKIDLDTFDVLIPGLITTKWYQKGKMWTQHFIYFCMHYKLYTLYINLPESRSLAEHCHEKGVHFSETLGPVHKLAENISMIFPQHLNKYNFAGTLEHKVNM